MHLDTVPPHESAKIKESISVNKKEQEEEELSSSKNY